MTLSVCAERGGGLDQGCDALVMTRGNAERYTPGGKKEFSPIRPVRILRTCRTHRDPFRRLDGFGDYAALLLQATSGVSEGSCAPWVPGAKPRMGIARVLRRVTSRKGSSGLGPLRISLRGVRSGGVARGAETAGQGRATSACAVLPGLRALPVCRTGRVPGNGRSRPTDSVADLADRQFVFCVEFLTRLREMCHPRGRSPRGAGPGPDDSVGRRRLRRPGAAPPTGHDGSTVLDGPAEPVGPRRDAVRRRCLGRAPRRPCARPAAGRSAGRCTPGGPPRR